MKFPLGTLPCAREGDNARGRESNLFAGPNADQRLRLVAIAAATAATSAPPAAAPTVATAAPTTATAAVSTSATATSTTVATATTARAVFLGLGFVDGQVAA